MSLKSSGEFFPVLSFLHDCRIDEMLVECVFDGKPCSHKNFTEFDWMQGDRCFTFNSGQGEHDILKVRLCVKGTSTNGFRDF